MGFIAEEKGVLKLVHPGRFVEVHKQPILAAEVMEKNPRHCITRPDVFEYPWIVVRPESMLNLGRVFLIVPNRTIHQLIKDKGYRKQPSPPCLRIHPSCVNIFHQRSSELDSPRKADAGTGTTPKHQSRRNQKKSRFQDDRRRRKIPDQVQEQEREHEYESAAEIIMKYQGSYLEFKKISMADFSETSTEREDDSRVKSCIKKGDSERKLQRLRVAFMLPAVAKGEESNRTFTVRRTN